MRRLTTNTIYTAVKGLRSFLRFLRDERGVLVAVGLRKLVAKPSDAPKLDLLATDLGALAAAILPAALVPARGVLCCTGCAIRTWRRCNRAM